MLVEAARASPDVRMDGQISILKISNNSEPQPGVKWE